MPVRQTTDLGNRGQVLALFAISATVLILMVGLVIDGGNALTQRRASQNTSDFAALAGARVIATWIDKDYLNGTDANVVAAINSTVARNGGDPVTYGTPSGPWYVDGAGAFAGWVGTGLIPTGTEGVTVGTNRNFSTYFLGIAGFNHLDASTVATARGGYAASGPGGNVFPAGISLAFFQTYPFCTGAVGSSSACQPQHLTPGYLNVPGGFGWLTFGTDRKCSGFGLGMIDDGCDPSKPFLQGEIGHPGGAATPPGNSYGCCDAVSGDPTKDRIGSLPGGKASADCTWYIENKVTVTVPIWDYADGNGFNDGSYHIIGFAGFQITACKGGKDIEGVWRKEMTVGPTTAVSPGFWASLAVQLVK
jgi:hypothetical protein